MSRYLTRLGAFLLNTHVQPALCSQIAQYACLVRVRPNLTFPCLTAKNLSQSSGIQGTISSLQLKKRPVRKRKLDEEEGPKTPNILAFATAEEYNLEGLLKGLKIGGLYEPQVMENNEDVVHAVAKYEVDEEPREIFFFREGSIVLWNTGEFEVENLRQFLKPYELDAYSESVVQQEGEIMCYKHHDDKTSSDQVTALSKTGVFLLENLPRDKLTLVKYTISNAMALSVKLAMWEASLENYIDSIQFVTEDLKKGHRIRMTQSEVLRKHGELFALRHVINLSSDLLDTPDFYWENDNLEALYLQVCAYFGISKRTKVMNEKINHCVELIELLASHLSDKHHIRLEWMIILLIMVEVAFEIIHYTSRYLGEDAAESH